MRARGQPEKIGNLRVWMSTWRWRLTVEVNIQQWRQKACKSPGSGPTSPAAKKKKPTDVRGPHWGKGERQRWISAIEQLYIFPVARRRGHTHTVRGSSTSSPTGGGHLCAHGWPCRHKTKNEPCCDSWTRNWYIGITFPFGWTGLHWNDKDDEKSELNSQIFAEPMANDSSYLIFNHKIFRMCSYSAWSLWDFCYKEFFLKIKKNILTSFSPSPCHTHSCLPACLPRYYLPKSGHNLVLTCSTIFSSTCYGICREERVHQLRKNNTKHWTSSN